MSEDAPIERLCREGDAMAIAFDPSSPDVSLVPAEARREVSRVASVQAISPDVPFYESLLLANDGVLWRKRPDSARAAFHPGVVRLRRDLESPRSRWEVFGSDGEFCRVVGIDRRFRPLLLDGSTALGAQELESGEIAIGRAEIGDECD